MSRGNRWRDSLEPAAAKRGGLLFASAMLLLVLAGTLAACGAASDEGGGTTAGSRSDAIVHPTGESEIVLQVSSGGGFVPVSYSLTLLPEFSLYGDGTVVVTGPMTEIYPGPALPNLQTTTIGEEAVQAILSSAREAGLFASGVDYGQPSITDVPTTTIVINADETTYLSAIYALGMESGAGGLTMEQQQARAAIEDFRAKLLDLSAFETGTSAWKPYEYTALAVYSLAVDPGYAPDPNDVQPNRLVWPLDDLSTLGEQVQPEDYRRAVISGPDLAKLQPLLEQATQITVWSSGNHDYNLYFRPLLPDESV